jgi:hypothetical protein
MRYGAVETNLGEWLALKLGKVPLPILDVLLGPLQARALIAAGKTGVLGRLARGPATTEALARELTLDAECLRLVLRVLRAMGYADLRHGAGAESTWSLTAIGKRHFGEDAEERYDAFVDYGPPQWTMVENLEKVLATGKGIEFHDLHTPEEWASYQAAMFENARAFAWFVVDHLPVPAGATTCIDIAGSHGWVSAALCRKHDGLRSTILDRPEALATARGIAKEHGYGAKLEFREFDLRDGNFGRDVDVALACNILHHFPADKNREILDRIRPSLKKGGVIGIFEIETPADNAAADAAGDALALYFRITSTSTCFRGEDYVGWLTAAGFENARIVRSIRMPSRMLVVANA